ncbi:hypothetical protein O181_115450 [Austropuccinia psidii MF-1]|uniref:Uncharacterized protein n=1 Tax=Austropuccinia psidii MF-1 TaxID=1389203 RepID=A0A9Q3PWI0_9BASI|nr:hypothetical protein [Austropuccinia psidii MF-1]
MASYNIWAGVEVGESLHERSQVVIGLPGKGLGKRPNIHATKKTNIKRCTFAAAKYFQDQGDEMINVEVGHIDNQPPHTESPTYSMKQSMMKPLPTFLEIFKLFKKGRQLNMIQWDEI